MIMPATLPAGEFSGPAIPQFSGGWAVVPFVGTKPKAHYWRDVSDNPQYRHPCNPLGSKRLRSLCGVVAGINPSRGIPALGAGSLKPCKHCMRWAKAWPNREERKTFLETVPGARAALLHAFGRGSRV